jgi:hypothetical protein
MAGDVFMKHFFRGMLAQIYLRGAGRPGGLNQLLAIIAALGFTFAAHAQPDYPPALWNQAYPGHWYTTGYGHYFCVIHDMEGYYEDTISYFQQESTEASIYYCVNSLQNGSDNVGHAENNPNDAPAGQITQMVREQYWAWHVICWNPYMFGTEHEGFVDTPVWYSETMYEASALLQSHFCLKYNIPIDRNHLIGHDEWQNPVWTNWMATNWPQIDTTCNNHTDPGQYWNWSHFMQLILNDSAPVILSQPTNQSVPQGSTVVFSVIASNNPSYYQWYFNTTNAIAGGTNASLVLSNVPLTASGFYSVTISNTNSSVGTISTNALLTVTPVLVVSNVASMPHLYNAIITWTTSTNGTTQVAYGPTPAMGSLSALDTNLLTNHAVMLNGLTASTFYYFQVISTTPGYPPGTGTGTFSTDVSLILTSGNALYSGVWTVASAAPDKYSAYYEYAGTAGGSDTATAVFRPNIVTPGQYDVYLWYSASSNRSQAAPVTVGYQGGSAEDYLDETTNGGSWQLLVAGQNFAAGTNGYVRLGNGTGEANRVVIADAVRLVYTRGQDVVTNGTVPGWWASFYFGSNVNAALDPDGDGYSTYAEYVLSTSPADPTSHFSLTGAPTGGGFQLLFSPWSDGRIYQLQTSASLTNPSWTTIPGLTVTTTTNGQGIINYTNGAAANAYYRLSAAMAP